MERTGLEKVKWGSSCQPGLVEAEIKNDQELEAAEQVADTEVKQAEKAKKLMLSEKAVSQESITVGRKLKSR